MAGLMELWKGKKWRKQKVAYFGMMHLTRAQTKLPEARSRGEVVGQNTELGMVFQRE